MASFLLTAETGSAAGVASYPAQPLFSDTAGEVADGILEVFKCLRLEFHYLIYILRSDTEIEA